MTAAEFPLRKYRARIWALAGFLCVFLAACNGIAQAAPDTECPSFVEHNPIACHSERSEESRHFFALVELSNAGILRFAQNDRRRPFALRMTNNPYQLAPYPANLIPLSDQPENLLLDCCGRGSSQAYRRAPQTAPGRPQTPRVGPPPLHWWRTVIARLC